MLKKYTLLLEPEVPCKQYMTKKNDGTHTNF